MLIVLVCTEGEVSEPAYIKALKSTYSGQAPSAKLAAVEILPLPLGGNQGHVKLIETANEKVSQAETDQESILSLMEEYDDTECEKWLICDYDDMDKHGVEIDELRQKAEESGYHLVINKPNFEAFVLMHFISVDKIAKLDPKSYKGEINRQVDLLNTKNLEKGFTKTMLTPPYAKKKYHAETFFGSLLPQNIELINEVLLHKPEYDKTCFSEMPTIIARLKDIYS